MTTISQDVDYLSIRNVTAYNPDNSFISTGYVMTVSSYGQIYWTNNLSTLYISTLSTNTINMSAGVINDVKSINVRDSSNSNTYPLSTINSTLYFNGQKILTGASISSISSLFWASAPGNNSIYNSDNTGGVGIDTNGTALRATFDVSGTAFVSSWLSTNIIRMNNGDISGVTTINGQPFNANQDIYWSSINGITGAISSKNTNHVYIGGNGLSTNRVQMNSGQLSGLSSLFLYNSSLVIPNVSTTGTSISTVLTYDYKTGRISWQEEGVSKGAVNSITGSANQISTSGSTGAVTLSLAPNLSRISTLTVNSTISCSSLVSNRIQMTAGQITGINLISSANLTFNSTAGGPVFNQGLTSGNNIKITNGYLESNSVFLSTIIPSTNNPINLNGSLSIRSTLFASTISTNQIRMNNGDISGVTTINGRPFNANQDIYWSSITGLPTGNISSNATGTVYIGGTGLSTNTIQMNNGQINGLSTITGNISTIGSLAITNNLSVANTATISTIYTQFFETNQINYYTGSSILVNGTINMAGYDNINLSPTGYISTNTINMTNGIINDVKSIFLADSSNSNTYPLSTLNSTLYFNGQKVLTGGSISSISSLFWASAPGDDSIYNSDNTGGVGIDTNGAALRATFDVSGTAFISSWLSTNQILMNNGDISNVSTINGTPIYGQFWSTFDICGNIINTNPGNIVYIGNNGIISTNNINMANGTITGLNTIQNLSQINSDFSVNDLQIAGSPNGINPYITYDTNNNLLLGTSTGQSIIFGNNLNMQDYGINYVSSLIFSSNDSNSYSLRVSSNILLYNGSNVITGTSLISSISTIYWDEGNGEMIYNKNNKGVGINTGNKSISTALDVSGTAIISSWLSTNQLQMNNGIISTNNLTINGNFTNYTNQSGEQDMFFFQSTLNSASTLQSYMYMDLSKGINQNVRLGTFSRIVQTSNLTNISSQGPTNLCLQVNPGSSNPDGKVGIGLYNPTELLDVNGNIRADGYLSTNTIQMNSGVINTFNTLLINSGNSNTNFICDSPTVHSGITLSSMVPEVGTPYYKQLTLGLYRIGNVGSTIIPCIQSYQNDNVKTPQALYINPNGGNPYIGADNGGIHTYIQGGTIYIGQDQTETVNITANGDINIIGSNGGGGDQVNINVGPNSGTINLGTEHDPQIKIGTTNSANNITMYGTISSFTNNTGGEYALITNTYEQMQLRINQQNNGTYLRATNTSNISSNLIFCYDNDTSSAQGKLAIGKNDPVCALDVSGQARSQLYVRETPLDGILDSTYFGAYTFIESLPPSNTLHLNDGTTGDFIYIKNGTGTAVTVYYTVNNSQQSYPLLGLASVTFINLNASWNVA